MLRGAEPGSLVKRPSVGALLLVLTVAIIALAGWSASQRLASIATGHDVPIELRLSHEQGLATLGLGDQGSTAGDVSVNSITVPVEEPSSAVLRALWAQAIARLVALVAGTVVAALMLVRLARGGLDSGVARLAFVAAAIVAADWGAQAVLERAASADVRELLFDQTLEGAWPPVDLAPLGWVLFLVALGCALRIGERLRRETEGLV